MWKIHSSSSSKAVDCATFRAATTLLLFDRDPCRIDAAVERVDAMQAVPAPELDRSQPGWKNICSDDQAGFIRISQVMWRPGPPSRHKAKPASGGCRLTQDSLDGERLCHVVKHQRREFVCGSERPRVQRKCPASFSLYQPAYSTGSDTLSSSPPSPDQRRECFHQSALILFEQVSNLLP